MKNVEMQYTAVTPYTTANNSKHYLQFSYIGTARTAALGTAVQEEDSRVTAAVPDELYSWIFDFRTLLLSHCCCIAAVLLLLLRCYLTYRICVSLFLY